MSHLSSEQYQGIMKSLQRANLSIQDLSEKDLSAIRMRVANNYQVYPGQAPPSPPALQIVQILQRFQINLLAYRELLKRIEEAPVQEEAPAAATLADPLGEIGDIMQRTRSYAGEMRMQVINAILGYIADKSVKPLKYQYVLEHFEYIDLAENLLAAGVLPDHFIHYLETYHMMSVSPEDLN